MQTRIQLFQAWGASRTTVDARTPERSPEKQKDLIPGHFAGGRFRTLTAAVMSQIGLPVSGYTVTAFLESQGWTEQDAQRWFGSASLMDLGEAIYTRSRSAVSDQPAATTAALEVERSTTRLRGGYFLALALIQLVALLVAGISFGGGGGLSALTASFVSVGLLLSLVWANGFSQLLARDAMRLHLEGDDALAGRAALRMLGLAMGLAAAVAAGVWGVAALAGVVSGIVGLSAVYFVLLAGFWLLVNALFALDLSPFAVVAALVGLGVAVVSLTWLPARTPYGSGLGLLIADVTMTAILVVWWGRKMRRSLADKRLPRLTAVWLDQWAYFAYGVGVMLLIVVDRLAAWSVTATSFGFNIQASYEVGLGWALFGFLGMVAIHEPILAKFLKGMRLGLQHFRTREGAAFAGSLRRAYAGLMLTAVVSAAVVAALVVLAVQLLSSSAMWEALLPTAQGMRTLYVGLAGFALLALALVNTGIVIALSRPQRLLAPLAVSLAADVTTAWLATMWLGYEGSVLGLVVGAGLMLAFSVIEVRRLLATPGHALYASF